MATNPRGRNKGGFAASMLLFAALAVSCENPLTERARQTQEEALSPRLIVSVGGSALDEASSLEFSDTAIGRTKTLILELGNAGQADLIIAASDVSVDSRDQDGSGPITIATLPPASIAAGSSGSTMTLAFTPLDAQTRSATLTIRTNDVTNPAFTVAIKGRGVLAVPYVATGAAVPSSETSMSLTGTIRSNGGATISASGFCWSANPDPTLADSHAEGSVAAGLISGTMSGLSLHSVYHIRAYATNSIGTGYGEDLSVEASLCRISFDSRGGSVVDPLFVDYGEHAEAPSAPLRPGYAFKGWYADSACATAWDFPGSAVPGSMTLYAGWEGLPFSVTFDKNDGSATGIMAALAPVICGSSLYLPACAFSKPGFAFDSWNTMPDGSGDPYADASGITMGAADLVLYARYKRSSWARTVSSGSDAAIFRAMAVDGSGNVYAVGWQLGTGEFDYGNGVTVRGANGSNSRNNGVLVKYDGSGTALWARALSGPDDSSYYGAGVDGSGNVYVAGNFMGPGPFAVSDTVSVSVSLNCQSPLLVKFDPSGNALWARTTTTGGSACAFWGLAVDESGNAYAAGIQWGSDSFTYGPGVSAVGAAATAANAILVKYNSGGTALWARSTSQSSGDSQYSAVALSPSGSEVYAAGFQTGAGSFVYGGVAFAGLSSQYGNSLVVRFDAATGTASNVSGAVVGGNSSRFSALAVDATGAVYAGGNQAGSAVVSYGRSAPAVSIAGSSSTGNNCVLVKFSPALEAAWARTANGPDAATNFTSLAVDPAGHVYAAGQQSGSGAFDYGNGTCAAGAFATGNNALIVQYDGDGLARWAFTTASSTVETRLNRIAVSPTDGSLLVVGYQGGGARVVYQDGVEATGPYAGGSNPLAAKIAR